RGPTGRSRARLGRARPEPARRRDGQAHGGARQRHGERRGCRRLRACGDRRPARGAEGSQACGARSARARPEGTRGAAVDVPAGRDRRRGEGLAGRPRDSPAARRRALARAGGASGGHARALDAYTRAVKDASVAAQRPEASLGYARLLSQDKRWGEGRGVLERVIRSDDTNAVAAAAVGIGETYQGEGDFLAAAEYFMTAAYVAPESPAGRRGLLGAGASFAAQ